MRSCSNLRPAPCWISFRGDSDVSQQVTSNQIEFDQLADLFVQQSALFSPSELHGYLCGQLAAATRLSLESWFQAAALQLGLDDAPAAPLKAGLATLYHVSLAQMEQPGFELQPLLPDDDDPLPQRAESLGLWCHGFVCGYTLANGKPADQLSEDASDGLKDLSRIAQIAVDDAAEDESEADFMEIAEYARMVALLVFSECNRPVADPKSSSDSSLH